MAYSINAKKSMKDGKLENTEVSVQHKTVPKYFLHCLSLPEGFCRDLNDVTLAVKLRDTKSEHPSPFTKFFLFLSNDSQAFCPFILI